MKNVEVLPPVKAERQKVARRKDFNVLGRMPRRLKVVLARTAAAGLAYYGIAAVAGWAGVAPLVSIFCCMCLLDTVRA